MNILEFYKNKNVLVTGHTGFKGTWLCKILLGAGANITGYALAPPESGSLYELSQLEGQISSIFGDIRDYNKLFSVFQNSRPEIVFHLAAQPIVRESYKLPVYTYETNVMGTVNICECIHNCGSVRSFLNVTTDKVYYNNEWEWGYRETDPLDGYDPYSNSKSCSELVTHCYQKSFLGDNGIAVSTARAGNVIGGGDFSKDRILPDCIKAALKREDIIVRNPFSTRPYQHVLEPLMAYLTIAKEQYNDINYASCYNIGPDDHDCVTTGEIVEKFCKIWGEGQGWRAETECGPHEANFLKLDCSRMGHVFQWKPRWSIDDAVFKTVEWAKTYRDGGNIPECMERQIKEYQSTAIKA